MKIVFFFRTVGRLVPGGSAGCYLCRQQSSPIGRCLPRENQNHGQPCRHHFIPQLFPIIGQFVINFRCALFEYFAIKIQDFGRSRIIPDIQVELQNVRCIVKMLEVWGKAQSDFSLSQNYHLCETTDILLVCLEESISS